MGDTTGGRRAVVLRVSWDLLREVLLLPPDCRVVGVNVFAFFDTDDIALRVESDEFPPVPEGQPLPIVGAHYSNVMTARFDGWDGLPPA